jgi:MoaA/NifB/PqqE/SkfB family radical SAM enzyme
LSALRYLPFARRALFRAGPPLHLTLFVTGVCNLRCRHCFHFEEVAAGLPGPTADQVEALAASCERMGPLLWVAFGGGEPFLREDLPELAGSFARRGLRHLSIPTNGLVARQHGAIDAILDDAPDLFLNVGVSIDGPPQVHDAIRGAAGSHGRSVEALRALLEQRARRERAPGGALGVGVIVTVTRENQEVLADHLEELVREVRPDHVTVNLARGTALDTSLLEVDPDRYAEVVARKRALEEEGVLGGYDYPLSGLATARDRLMYEHVEAQARGDGARFRPCTAGTLSAVVFEGGEVHPCEVLGSSLGNLGDVDWDLSRLWGEDAATELRRRIRDTRCACTWECASADNVLFDPASWPRLALDSLRGAARGGRP